jgi:hypothetical protein
MVWYLDGCILVEKIPRNEGDNGPTRYRFGDGFLTVVPPCFPILRNLTGEDNAHSETKNSFQKTPFVSKDKDGLFQGS